MKGLFNLIGAILNSYVFLVIAYIIALIIFSLTGSKAVLSGACGIILFFVFVSGSSFRNADDKEKDEIYQFNQWIAIVSIFFILQHFFHIFTNMSE